MLRLPPYRLRFLVGTLIWGLLECRWQGKGLREAVAYVGNFLRALPGLYRTDLSAPFFYSARWEAVKDIEALRRNLCKFVTTACNRAPRPYGDGRFRLAILAGGAPIGREPFEEFSFQELPRLKQEILEEWFPQGLGIWEGEDFEAVLLPVGALLNRVSLRAIPEYPGSRAPDAPAPSACQRWLVSRGRCRGSGHHGHTRTRR